MFAAYFDESGNSQIDPARMVVAGVVATSADWIAFEQKWRYCLDYATSVRGYRDFHAKNAGPVQELMNLLLAHVMRDSSIVSYCVTMDAADYKLATSISHRSQLGNAFGFATFACVSVVGAELRRAVNIAEVGYYIEQGGPGSAKAIEILSSAYRDAAFRKSLGLSAFGQADRRVHLPVHSADLVAHEVATNPDHSPSLTVLGDRVIRTHISPQLLREILPEYDSILRGVKWLNVQRKNARKEARGR